MPIDIPKLLGGESIVFVDGEVAWGEFGDPFVDGIGVRDVLVGEVEVDGAWGDFAWDVIDLHEGFEFAGEDELSAAVGVVERLFAESIAGQDKLLLSAVPDGDGEHAIEMGEAIGTEIFVEVDDGLGIAFGAKLVAGAFESSAEFAVIVDFAIEDDLDGSIFIGEGLVSGFEIDNRESAEAKGDTGVDTTGEIVAPIVQVGAGIVRTAMFERGDHSLELFSGYGVAGIGPDPASDSTHTY